MSFRKFVCWQGDQVQRVMDTEALQTPDHVFLATHNPIMMSLQSLTELKALQEYTEQQFLNDFLGTPDFAFVPVLGGAGTGKSHLIRWLATKIEQIPTDKKRKVLLIPRSGTNLRDIIERILTVIEGPRAVEYRKRLTNATNTLKEGEARGMLLNNLANLIEHTSIADPDEAVQYVATNLPALLLDWHFRQFLLKDNAIIDRLVTHIIGYREGIEVVEERRRFTVGDLPLKVLDIKNAGATARDFYAYLIATTEFQQTVVNLLNDHLDAAIALMLQLNREDLEQLMREVREMLAEQDVELILLIEDFAKLQGIDRQVLAAVIERPEEPGRPRQCALRTALGCTVGYFENLVGTVKQRTTFSVSLDLDETNLVKQDDVLAFIARYLNAARVSEKTLVDWYNLAVNEAEVTNDSVPNQCESCPHIEPCHAAFGQSKGFGIYPFTNTAIEQMLKRVNRGRFNPRLVIKDILRHILDNYAESLAAGQFPSPALAQHFGGSQIGAQLRMQINRADPVNHARREVLLDLWTDGSSLCNLDSRIHEAFDLPLLGDVGQVVQTPTPANRPDVLPSDSRAVSLPSKLLDRLDGVDKWSNGSPLPQQVAQELRPMIFAAVAARIPWDAELLLRGNFVGKSFRSAHINFHNAVTSTKSASGVELVIAKDGRDLTEEAVALQALLRHQHYGGWSYPDGAVDFRTYAGRLETWSLCVLEQIRRRPRISGVTWDPVPAVTELLALGVRMAGFPKTVDYSLADLADALFSSYDVSVANSRSTAWQELFKVFCDRREELVETLKAFIPCTKGGHSRLQVVDAVQLIEPLRNLRKTWKPQTEVPSDLRSDLNVIQKVREKVDQLLMVAITDEKTRHRNWLEETTAMLGDVGRSETVQLLRTAIERAQASGDFSAGGTTPEELTRVIDSFKNSHFDNCLAVIKRAIQATEPGTVFEELSRIPQETMIKTEDFLLKAKSFLANSANRVNTGIENLGGADELESTQEAIRITLDKIRQIAKELGDTA